MSDSSPDTVRESEPLTEALLLIADELDKARDLAINGQIETIASVGALRETVHATASDLGDQMQRGFAMLAKLIEDNKADTDMQITAIRAAKYSNGHTAAE